MKRRWVILVIAGIALAVLVGVLVLPGRKEPVFGGKNLSEWAAMRTDNRDGRAIVGHFGTNALPWLVGWLGWDDLPPWQVNILKQLQKLPGPYGGNYARKLLIGTERLNRSNFAHLSFYVLGLDARPAIPGLATLAMDTRRPRGAKAAAEILWRFGSDVVPEMLAVLRKLNAPGRRVAIHYFDAHSEELGTNSAAVAEALAWCLDDHDWQARNDAALALCNLPLNPAVVVPALTKSTADPISTVRMSSLDALARFAETAHSAIPAVIRALTDGDPNVRGSARFALWQIAPEMLAKENEESH